MVDGSFPNWKPGRRGTPGSPIHFGQALSSQVLGIRNKNSATWQAPQSLLSRALLGMTQTFSEKTYKYGGLYNVWNSKGGGQEELSCLGKLSQSRLDWIENAPQRGSEPWDYSEEKQPRCPAEASRERRSHHSWATQEFEAGKEVLVFSLANNSLLKNRRELGLLVLKGSYGRCQEKKLRAIHMFQLHFIIKPILLSLQLTSDKSFWLTFVSEYFIFGTFCVLETVPQIPASMMLSPFSPRKQRFLSSFSKQNFK